MLDLILTEPALENHAESIYSLERPDFLKKTFCGSEGELRHGGSATFTPLHAPLWKCEPHQRCTY